MIFLLFNEFLLYKTFKLNEEINLERCKDLFINDNYKCVVGDNNKSCKKLVILGTFESNFEITHDNYKDLFVETSYKCVVRYNNNSSIQRNDLLERNLYIWFNSLI